MGREGEDTDAGAVKYNAYIFIFYTDETPTNNSQLGKLISPRNTKGRFIIGMLRHQVDKPSGFSCMCYVAFHIQNEKILMCYIESNW